VGEGGLRSLSPIHLINNQTAEEYLTKFARKHSPGNLDPHADWNALMFSPAQVISGDEELFRNLVLYPGDNITITLANGTAYGPVPFQGIYTNSGPTGPLETGGDFYNFFVLGLYPWGFYKSVIEPFLEAEAAVPPMNSFLTSPGPLQPSFSSPQPLSKGWHEVDSAWPQPNILQAGFEGNRGAMLTGKISIALSICRYMCSI
jgi:hypothetical protein